MKQRILNFKEKINDCLGDWAFISSHFLLDGVSYIKGLFKPKLHIFYHRHFVDITDPAISPLLVMRDLQKNFSSFLKIKQIQFKNFHDNMQVGDEFELILKKNTAKFRIMDIQENQFSLITLSKKFEPGIIHFEIQQHAGFWRLSIECLFQSCNLKLIKSKNLPLYKIEQLHLWSLYCEEFFKKCYTRMLYPPKIINEAINDQTRNWEPEELS